MHAGKQHFERSRSGLFSRLRSNEVASPLSPVGGATKGIGRREPQPKWHGSPDPCLGKHGSGDPCHLKNRRGSRGFCRTAVHKAPAGSLLSLLSFLWPFCRRPRSRPTCWSPRLDSQTKEARVGREFGLPWGHRVSVVKNDRRIGPTTGRPGQGFGHRPKAGGVPGSEFWVETPEIM